MVVSTISQQFRGERPAYAPFRRTKVVALIEKVAARFHDNDSSEKSSSLKIAEYRREISLKALHTDLTTFLHILFYVYLRLPEMQPGQLEVLVKQLLYYYFVGTTGNYASWYSKKENTQRVRNWICRVFEAMRDISELQPIALKPNYGSEQYMNRAFNIRNGTKSSASNIFCAPPVSVEEDSETKPVTHLVSKIPNAGDCRLLEEDIESLKSKDFLFHLRNFNSFSGSVLSRLRETSRHEAPKAGNNAEVALSRKSCKASAYFQQSKLSFGTTWNNCAFGYHRTPPEASDERVVQETEPLDWRASAVLNSVTSDLFRCSLPRGPSQKPLGPPEQTCCLCEESVTSKKFFGQRRFAILSGCDHVLCIGCARSLRMSPDLDGEHSVSANCPQCGTQSVMIATSSSWMTGTKKVEYFRRFLVSHTHTEVARMSADAKRWLL